MIDQTVGIAATARAMPNKIALVFDARRVSFHELDRLVTRAASAFALLGISKGDRVAVAVRNRPEFFEAACAAARLGAEVVAIPWRAKDSEVEYLVEDSGARLVVTGEETSVPARAGVAVLTIGSSYEQARDADVNAAAPALEDPAPVVFRYYTSGTTGRPKAVEREGGGPGAALRSALSLTEFWDVTGNDDVHLVCGPLYHTAPCAYANYALLRGQTVVILDHFDPIECLQAIEFERVTWTHMVPINFVRILRSAAADQFDLSSVRRIIHAAAPCPVEVKRAILEVFPPGTVWEYYGATEGFATVISPDEWVRKPGSVGRPAHGVTLTVRDPKGNELPAGHVGLVYVTPSGGKPFSYAGDAQKTRDAWLGDQFTVGDMGYVDDDGYLFLTDRKQDLIISGGANIYPAEVEAVLYQHPGIADGAVIGIPDDEWGERVHAIVEGSVSPDEVIAWCRERLAHYKCPRSVDVVHRLPRDENGKVRKRDLREQYWAGRSTRI